MFMLYCEGSLVLFVEGLGPGLGLGLGSGMGLGPGSGLGLRWTHLDSISASIIL